MKNISNFLSYSRTPQLLKGNIFAMSDYSIPGSNNSGSFASNNGNSPFSPKKIKRFFRNSPYLPFIVVIILVVIVAIVAVRSVVNKSSASAPSILSTDKRENINKPIAQQLLNRSFNFPLKDGTGKEVSQLKYEIQSAELRDQIIVKGQSASAVKGRVFLILSLKITNSYDKSVQLSSKDYVRLITGSSPEKLAADIHNDPVDVQAISTKYTRLGFPINDTEKSLTIQVGEISGKKDLITLNLK